MSSVVPTSEPRQSTGLTIALIAVFAALIAALALVPPVFTVGAVPFALQIIVVVLNGLVLGPWAGFAAAALYLVAGVAGLPVFAGGAAGPSVLVGPTGGYLIGYALAAIASGLIVKATLRKGQSVGATTVWLAVAAVVAILVIHVCGVVGFIVLAKMKLGAAITATLPFLPLDLLKGAIAVAIALAIYRAFPRLYPAVR